MQFNLGFYKWELTTVQCRHAKIKAENSMKTIIVITSDLTGSD